MFVVGCSYFAAQTLAEEAQLVFCPYNYIVNPIVRRAMDIDLKGAIVILDEAQYALQTCLVYSCILLLALLTSLCLHST